MVGRDHRARRRERNDENMKLKMALLMMCGIVLAALSLTAETETVGDYTWTYHINGDTAEICKGYYSAAISPLPTGAVSIPHALGGKPVTIIGDCAFYNCSDLMSVTIPESVTSIGIRAFSGCRSLQGITIPNSITSIGAGAFSLCDSLTSVYIADIGVWCGIEFYSLDSNPLYYAHDLYLNGALVTDLTVPESVTRIGSLAFAGCSNLVSIVIQNSVQNIGSSAFWGCNRLARMTLPFVGAHRGSLGDGAETVDGDRMFGYIFGEGEYPDSYQTGFRLTTDSSWYRFRFPDSLKEVYITDDTFINPYAFQCCRLSHLEINEGVTHIGNYAFMGMGSWDSECKPDVLVLPCTTEKIGDGALDSVGNNYGQGRIIFKGNAPEGVVKNDDYSIYYVPSAATGWEKVEDLYSDYEWFKGIIRYYDIRKVSLNLNTGNETDNQSIWWLGFDAEYPQPMELPIPVRRGCTFEGWYHESQYVDADLDSFFQSLPEGDVTLVAQWRPNTYNFVFDANGGKGGCSRELEFGTPVEEPVVTRTGYRFSGWIPAIPITVPDENMLFTAQWERLRYRIIFDANGGQGGTNVLMDYGDAIVVPTVVREGYTFMGWRSSDDGSDVVVEVVPAHEITYVAQWKVNLYNVEFRIGEHGVRLGGGALEQTVKYHEAAVEPDVAADEGWMFQGWDADFSCVTSNLIVQAIVRRMYTVEEALASKETSVSLRWTIGANAAAAANGCADETAAGGKSVKFSAADDAAVWVETFATNACRVSFDWKCSCEGLVKGKPYDYLLFEVDGVQQDFICGDTDWTNATFYVTGDGEHCLRWIFKRDENGSSGEDSAWLANVAVVQAVMLTFGAGGATEGAVPGAVATYSDESIVLPGQGTLVWPKHAFLGWHDGTALYGAGVRYLSSGPALLTALWSANTLALPVITAPVTYEADSVTVTIAAENGATVYYTTDGSTPKADGTGCRPYQGSFEIEGSVTIRAIAVRDNYYDSEVASFTVTRPTWTFGEYLNCPERTFSTGGDAEWVRAKGVSADGYALKSGDITHSQTSRLETVVHGAGTIEFNCKVDGEIVKKIVYDGLAFCIDGMQQSDLIGGNEWTAKSFVVVGDGRHVLSWLYVKDEEGNGGGEDCAWLDNVVWTPADPLPALDSAATDNDAKAIVAGLSDVRLSEKIGSSAEYAAFRNWVDSSELSHALVKGAPNAWLSYALDAPALMARNAPLASEDIVIESIEPSSAATGAFDLVVDIADAEIGEGARIAEALGVEGAAELIESAFSSEGLSVTLKRTADGKVKAAVTPDGAPPAFFLRMRVK